MKKKIIIIFNLIIIIIICLGFKYISKASNSEIFLQASKSNIEIGEEFGITINTNNSNIAAYTIWMYFDNEKLECISQIDNINILDNKIVYTWFSDTGKNKELSELFSLKFKAKQNGVSTISIAGEFYNENGEKINFEFNSLDITIGKESEENNISNFTDSEQLQKDVESLNLDIMRVNQEGISPDFNKNITQYYLIVDENTNKLNITAIPESSKAKVNITGNENLKNGLNVIKITVTLNDKNKTYYINVTKTNNTQSANTNLETLAVENYIIEPNYQSNITNYYVEVSNLETFVNILAIPEDVNSKVLISGNEKLDFGTNNVTITVTASNGITKKNYNIEIYKRNKEEEQNRKEEIKENEQSLNNILESVENDNIETNIIGTNQEYENENNKNIIRIIVICTIIAFMIFIGYIVIKKKTTQ